MRGALLRFRVMAFVVGILLPVLVFVGVPLQYAGHNDVVVRVVGPMHGFLYIVYLFTGATLARRAHWGLPRILAVVAAGLIPGLAFVVEHVITKRMRAEWPEELGVTSAAVPEGPTAVRQPQTP